MTSSHMFHHIAQNAVRKGSAFTHFAKTKTGGAEWGTLLGFVASYASTLNLMGWGRVSRFHHVVRMREGSDLRHSAKTKAEGAEWGIHLSFVTSYASVKNLKGWGRVSPRGAVCSGDSDLRHFAKTKVGGRVGSLLGLVISSI